MSTIVVGVDGSRGSLDAVRLAIDEARIRDAEAEAVGAWHLPSCAYGADWSVPVELDSFRETAQSALEQSLVDVGGADSGVTVTAVLAEGQPPRSSAARPAAPTCRSSARAGSAASQASCSGG